MIPIGPRAHPAPASPPSAGDGEIPARPARSPHPAPSGAPRPTRRSLVRGLPAVLGAAALGPGLVGCTHASERLDAETNAIPEVDLSGIEQVPELADRVPAAIREKGELVNGAALNYAPGEFVGSSGQPVGYDMDILAAVGRVLGLTTRTESAVFAQIIPSLGSKYDVGISSFTVNAERLETVHMVSYFRAGMAYAVKTGNPYGIDPANLCGTRAAHQVGTYMDDVVAEADQACRDGDDPGVTDLPYTGNADAATAVAGGKADVLLADSPVIAYAVDRSRGELEQIGGIEDSALNGIAVSLDQLDLAEVLAAAVQHLIDSGHMQRILAAWGNESGMIDRSEVDPAP